MIWFHKGRIPDGPWPFLSVTYNGLRSIEDNFSTDIDLTEGLGGISITGRMQAYRKALLHRVLDLTKGVVVCWNERALLGSLVCARSLLETLAIFHSFLKRADKKAKAKEWQTLSRLVDAYAFSTSSGPDKKNKSPESPPRVGEAVIEFIKRTQQDKEQFWEQICDEAHPNGKKMMVFGGLLKDLQYIDVPIEENERRLFPAVYNSLYSCCWLVGAMLDFDILLEEIRYGGDLPDDHELVVKRNQIDKVVDELAPKINFDLTKRMRNR